MKVIIVCSSNKNGDFISYLGKEIQFVANPDLATQSNTTLFVHPDENLPNSSNETWRGYVNVLQSKNRLLPAYQLYFPKIYKQLHQQYGKNLYILSAGWGLVNSEFHLPKYDITFSRQADGYKRRINEIPFNDFNHLIDDVKDNRIRALLEHYAIGCLCPKHLGTGA